MKKFSIKCNFGGQNADVDFYVGEPEGNHHPIHFQASWLSKERGGNVPGEVMDSLDKIKHLANQNNVPFADLCVYALGTAKEEEHHENSEEDNEESDSK